MSIWNLVLVPLGALCLGLALVELLRARMTSRAVRERQRLRSMASRISNRPIDSETESILRDRMGRRGLHMDGFAQTLPLHERAELLLYRAGVHWPVWRFALLSLVAGVAAGFAGIEWAMRYEVAALGFMVAVVLPWLEVLRRKRRRMKAFEQQLPQALDLICRALRAGHALSSGLKMVGDELDDPISKEFALVSDEIALGLEAREALANLCHRIDVADLSFFSTAVLIQRETGGNLAEIMDRLGYVIRERHKFYGKVKALTAQNRGAALILLATPPAFLILMSRTSPEFIEPLWTTPQGHMLGMVAAAMTLFGYLVARRLAVVNA
jgi:tight adherence protein B